MREGRGRGEKERERELEKLSSTLLYELAGYTAASLLNISMLCTGHSQYSLMDRREGGADKSIEY